MANAKAVAKERPVKKTGYAKLKYFDFNLLFLILFLVGFGLLMLYSTTSYTAQIKFGDSFYYVRKQGIIAAAGVVCMFIVSRIDYHVWYHLSPLAYLGALGLCALVPIIGVEINNSKRWIRITSSLTIQPSEIAKICIIIVLAAVISRIPKKMNKISTIIKVVFLALPIVGLVAVNNLSTAVILMGIVIMMVFIGSSGYRQFIIPAILVVGFLTVFLLLKEYKNSGKTI